MHDDEEPLLQEPAKKPVVPEYFTPSGQRRTPSPKKLVAVCRLPVLEAELARSKLESEGIVAFVQDTGMAMAHPLVLSDVPLMVEDEDLEHAREILARPAEEVEDGEYVDEPYRCPKCHRKAVDIVPLPPVWRSLKVICFGLWTVPLIVMIFQTVIDFRSVNRRISDLIDVFFFPWLIAIMALSLALIFVRRIKRCRECGHEWSGAGGETETE